MIESLDDVMESCNLKKLRVEFKSTEDTDLEYLDLIKHKLNDVVHIEDTRSNPITHERLSEVMVIYYNEKRKIFASFSGE